MPGEEGDPRNRSVLVTGAASGVGAAATRRFVTLGFRVFGTRPRARRDAEPNGVKWVEMDVRDEASVLRAMGSVFLASPRIDSVVCGAGLDSFGVAGDVSIGAAFRQFETNFRGTLRTLKVVLPRMRRQGSGRVVLLGPLAGRAPIPFRVHYAAAKAAIDALAVSLRREMRRFGVQVCLVAPSDAEIPFDYAIPWRNGGSFPSDERTECCNPSIRDRLLAIPGPETLAAAIETAVTARRARLRYVVSRDSSWFTPLCELLSRTRPVPPSRCRRRE